MVIAGCAALGACGDSAQSQPGGDNTGPQVQPKAAPVVAAPAVLKRATTKPPPDAPAATDGDSSDPVSALLRLPEDTSTSVGAPDNGSVKGAVRLPERGPGFRHNSRRPDGARFGTVELVQALIKAAGRLPPGPELYVNDIGLAEGGPIEQHGSHQAGRDVDILFFYRDREGRPHPPIGVPVEPDGTGVDYKDLSDPHDDVHLRFDAERTWRFVSALIDVAYDDIQRIFLVEHVRDALLKQARRSGAPARIVERFALVTCQPGTPHDDHMHVRFYCSPQDMRAGCLDKAPTYPWRAEALRRDGLTPAIARGRPTAKQRRARAARTTTAEEARTKAVKRYGKMHRDVIAFLKRRKAWQRRRGPVRPFCP